MQRVFWGTPEYYHIKLHWAKSFCSCNKILTFNPNLHGVKHVSTLNPQVLMKAKSREWEKTYVWKQFTQSWVIANLHAKFPLFCETDSDFENFKRNLQ